jgi:hypothetical protein
MEGIDMRRFQVNRDGNMTEQVNFFIYLGCSVSVQKMNMDLEENIQEYDKLNGVIKILLERYLNRNTINNAQWALRTSAYIWK